MEPISGPGRLPEMEELPPVARQAIAAALDMVRWDMDLDDNIVSRSHPDQPVPDCENPQSPHQTPR